MRNTNRVSLDTLFEDLFGGTSFFSDSCQTGLKTFDDIMQNSVKVVNNIAYPGYPVSNLYVEKDTGTHVLELAVTGFDKEEIAVSIVNKKLVVIGAKKTKIDGDTRKYIKNTLSTRDFENAYHLGKVFDLDQIEVKMDNGVLTITLPLKAEEKPVKREIEIN